jgi:N-acetylmuramoyl-L-alanine amidase
VLAPIYYTDDLYLPAQRVTALLEKVLDRPLVYDPSRESLTAISSDRGVVGVYVQEKLNGTLLEVALHQPAEYEVYVTEGNWVNVTIMDGVVDADHLSRERPSPKVRRIRAFQFENSAQVSIQMQGKILEYHDNFALNPPRVQIAIENLDFDPEGLDTMDIEPEDDYDPVDVIVIDPGHGGLFDGAIGRSGLKEKDIVLDISLRVEELLDRDTRFTPVLTRRRDHTVGLEQRALTANSAAGDLFVSIHTNSFDQPEAGGHETYFLAAAANDEARVTQLLENADFREEIPAHDDDDDLDFIVMDFLQTEYLGQSRRLAELIEERLDESLNIRNRGVNQAGFVVLNRVSMPGVLVETAFISNKVEEKLLTQESFRQSVAEAIYKGIVDFAEAYNRRSSADAGF